MTDISNFTINNGDHAKDRISGFKGIVTARSDHLNGCNRYYVSPPMEKGGTIPDSYWVDEADLIVTKKSTFGIQTPAKRERGGFPSTIK